jgi:RNA polymerase sigma factor (sigma-70 family)
MSEQDKNSSRKLVPAGHRDLARIAAANPLVSRAIADLAQGHLLKMAGVIRSDFNDALFYFERGAAWLDNREYDNAINDFDEAIRLDPNDAYSYMNRGLAWSGKKDDEKAIKDFDQAVRLNPIDARFYFIRGNAWFDKQDYDKAVADYDDAIKLDHKDGNSYYNRGLALLRKEDYDKAIKNYDEAIRVDPQNATLYYYRGLAFGSVGAEWCDSENYDKAVRHYERAIGDYEEAIRLDPNYALALKKSYEGSKRMLEILERKSLGDNMEQVLKTLTYREREIIKLRYGLGDGYTYTLEEVSRIFKVTPERIKEIEAKAVRKLQHPVRHRQLEGFLDILASKGLHLGGATTTEEFSDEEKAAILAKTVPELNLSKRTRMCMNRLRIYSLGDLTSRSADELLEEKNFGMTCLTEVREKLAQLGLTLRGE